MEHDNSTDNMNDLQAAGKNAAKRAGAAAQRVGNAARSAGSEVGEVASDELSNLRADLDDLISRIPSLSDIDLERAKERLMNKIADTREAAEDLAYDAREQLDYSVECTRDCIKEHPLQSVGYAAGLGFLLGLLLTRR